MPPSSTTSTPRRRSAPSPRTGSRRSGRSTSRPAASGATPALATSPVTLRELGPRCRGGSGRRGTALRTLGTPTRRFTMRRLAIALVLGATLPVGAADLPQVKPEEVGLSSSRLARIAETLKADVERGRIPGAVVVVARRGRIAYAEAVGFRDKTAGAAM